MTSSPSTPGSGRSRTSPSDQQRELDTRDRATDGRPQLRLFPSRLRLRNVVEAGASVCPQHCTMASVCSLTASSAGMAAGSPASIRQESAAPRSRGSSDEVLTRRSIVGTANIQVMCSSAMTSQHLVGVEPLMITLVPPHTRVGRTLQPPAYTSGATWSVRGLEGRTAGAHDPGVAEHGGASSAVGDRDALRLSGRAGAEPDVVEVIGSDRHPTDDARTRLDQVGERQPTVPVDRSRCAAVRRRRTTSSSAAAESSSATIRRTSASSMHRRSSWGAKRGFSGTFTRPALRSANSSTTYSRWFCAT